MPGYFFDSSALAKHYHVEVGTVEVDRILQFPDTHHFIARLALVEIRSVFAGKVRTGVITEDDFWLLRRRFLADVTARRLQVVSDQRFISSCGKAHRATRDTPQFAHPRCPSFSRRA